MNTTKMNTAKTYLTRISRNASLFAACFFLTALGCHTSQAYTNYTGCATCHGDFRGPTSTKGTVFPGGKNHDMHRLTSSFPNNMATACNLCHINTSHIPVIIGKSLGTANNPGIGCTGCHVAEGLRKHHNANGVTECYDCHDPNEVSAPENVKPPYYGTVDTRANNPGNTVLAANTNENWSVGDFIGLDNDGNNLYDLADYAVGPFKVLSLTPAGNNMSVKWLTAAGRTNWLQAAGTVAGTYANVSPAIAITNVGNVGLVTNTYVEVGGATNAARFYQIKGSIP
jgi:hypothetical protein